MTRARGSAEAALRSATQRAHPLILGRAAAGVYAALRVLVPPGAAVGLPANTCYVILWAVLRAGCTPVLLDIDPATGNLPPQPDAQGHTLAAIIPCHLYGLPAPMAAICAWAGARGIIVIEDAALAFGARVDGRPAGAWGDASVVSFGAGKIIDHGVGGALLADDARLSAEIMRLCANLPTWGDRLIELTNQWNALYWALHLYEDRNPGLAALYPQLYALYGELVAYRLADDDLRGLAGAIRAALRDRDQRAVLAAQYDEALGFEAGRENVQGYAALAVGNREPGLANPCLWKYPLLASPGGRDELLAHLWAGGLHEVTRWYPSLRVMAAALCPQQPQPPTPHADAHGAHILNLPLTDEATVRCYARAVRDFMARHPAS